MTRFSEMTIRERWEAVLNRKKPDRLPMSYRATEEFTDKLLKHTGCEDLDAFFIKYHVDRGYGISPRYAGPSYPEGEDMYGCRFKKIRYATGIYNECVYHPLAKYSSADEIEKNFTWPSPDSYDFSHIKETARLHKDDFIIVGGWEPFLVYKYLRGEEQGYIDLIENPGICKYIMQKLFEHAFELTRRTLDLAGGSALMSSCSEDLGGQTGLLYSPAHIREYFLPLHKKMIDMMHSYGVKVMWHTDGASRDIIPDLIETGIDILDPVQWRCPGMEREGLMEDFGDKLIFHGSIDNQWTLPFGTVDEVKNEVRENFKIFGKHGAYVMGPCHNFQPVGPPENAVAMYETGYAECKY